MIVLDTHAWIWWATDDRRLPGGARRIPRDPADRIIVATALAHRAPLVTRDERIQRHGAVEVVW